MTGPVLTAVDAEVAAAVADLLEVASETCSRRAGSGIDDCATPPPPPWPVGNR
ncbi:hypothetical protein [Rhodococcus phenolicus]|uniref:hypothetical protein n=1 Tax=Rhodococcus phenolicus TaxID=263849 RepID=UPI0012E8B440|nr:hypothetical protein [Rhodococcus phenolicus]